MFRAIAAARLTVSMLIKRHVCAVSMMIPSTENRPATWDNTHAEVRSREHDGSAVDVVGESSGCKLV